MNLSQFFEHWSIAENPFRGEEARHDSIFARMGINPNIARSSISQEALPGDKSLARPISPSMHSDFEKIMGELERPSTSIVFGEKGAGKTAIRLQIAGRIDRHNRENPERKIFMIPYDDLNASLDKYKKQAGTKGDKNPFEGMRLVDHMDAMISIGLGRVVNSILPGPTSPPPANLSDETAQQIAKRTRKLPAAVRRDLLLLQAIYDTNDPTGQRTSQFRQLLRLPSGGGTGGWNALIVIGLWIGWVPAVALFLWARISMGFEGALATTTDIVSGILLLAWGALLVKAFLLDRLVVNRVAGKLAKQLRMVNRPMSGYLGSIRRLPRTVLNSGELPTTDSDEQRYAMFTRLKRVIETFGFTGIMIVIDRVDEPTLVNGDPDRMRSIIWPMFNNKFLQLEGVGIKMLLPIELRHALFKESSAFFQEARLDKQNMIERLSWTGAMLYDLCNARLGVCRPASADPISLIDLFSQDVTRADVVDALGTMQQPRDAFKFMYRCLSEHCSSVTAEDGSWKIAKHTLDYVKREESERVMQLQRGIRPA
ncbi:MAG: hypothetical protein P1U42_03335 [Phycisphaerales bacterium]|nr:hypothetical protein [Phycisphaerales bacterium]